MDRRRFMFKKSRLPSEYQEVEWIDVSGISYIDTKMTVNDYDYVKAELYYRESGNNYPHLCGCSTSTTSGSENAKTFRIRDGYVNVIVYAFNGHWVYSETTFRQLIWQIIEFKSKPGEQWCKLDGNTIASSFYTKLIDNNYSVPLFAHRYGSAVIQEKHVFSGRSKGVVFKKNDENIRNFIPCYRKSDGVIGMYDLCGSICPLTNTPFYINAGTGTFAKGADVN